METAGEPTADRGAALTPAPAGLVDLLGLLACGELLAFERLAADGALTPRLEDRIAMAAHAAEDLANLRRLSAQLALLGVDQATAMAPFLEPLTTFHRLTRPADWYEGLVKAYVGEGLVGDFYREISSHLDEPTRTLIAEVSRSEGFEAYAVARLREAIADDPRLGGRLALWGRRIVGEALSQAQHVVAEREGLITLVLTPGAPIAAGLTRISDVLGLLQRRHAERMHALGLAP